MHRPPSAAAAASTTSFSPSGSPTSTVKPTPPISSATAWAASPSTSSTATCAPSAVIRRHVARPMPEPPPVTMARRPSRSPIAFPFVVLVASGRPPSRSPTSLVRPGRSLEHQRHLQLPDQQFLGHALVEDTVVAVHGGPYGGPTAGIDQGLQVEQVPLVGPPGPVEPHGVVQAGVGMGAPGAEAQRSKGGAGHRSEE